MKDSIVQRKQYQDRDLFDGSTNVCRHHIFEGVKNRKNSTDDGLWVSLTPEHHNEGASPAVGIRCDMHHCHMMAYMMHIIGELAWMLAQVTTDSQREKLHEEFRRRYGRDYL